MNTESRWLRAADRVIQAIASGVGASIQFVDLGSVGVIEYDNGPDNDGRVRPLLAVDGIHENTQIQASILASGTPTGERSVSDWPRTARSDLEFRCRNDNLCQFRTFDGNRA